MTRAVVVTRAAGGVSAAVEDVSDRDIGDGDSLIAVEYSGVNYKDGLAMGGAPGVMRHDRLIPGIDAVGSVLSSPHLPAGERVLLNGRGAGESRPGGYSERLRVPGEWLIRVPDRISQVRAAAIGTAGFTAMMAVEAIEAHADGDVLVTGASGGVGSLAVALLARLGHRVVASTGRPAETERLLRLGASEVIHRDLLTRPGRALQSQRWSAVVDSVGSHTLVNALAQTRYGGAVAACGLTQGSDLAGTVMPFILRAVTLTGINSVHAPSDRRERAWARLAVDLDLELLDSVTSVVELAAAPRAALEVVAGRSRGRTVVRVS